jgi:hypothetical protein
MNTENQGFWIDRLNQAPAGRARELDPFHGSIKAIMDCVGQCISIAALLDLLEIPRTTGNGRRVARTMRSLGYIPIKSRRLMPGGYRDTVTRGWTRPLLHSHKRR